MRRPSRALLLGLLGVLSACAQPSGVSPTGPMPSTWDETAGSAPRYQLHQLTWVPMPGYFIERQLLALTNEERAKVGLPPLVHRDDLASVAWRHSRDMATRNYLAHINPDGKDHVARLVDAGIVFRAGTPYENVAYAVGVTDVARTMMYHPRYGWMNSPGHRDNILRSTVNEIGIGVFKRSSDGAFYATQVLVFRRRLGRYIRP